MSAQTRGQRDRNRRSPAAGQQADDTPTADAAERPAAALPEVTPADNPTTSVTPPPIEPASSARPSSAVPGTAKPRPVIPAEEGERRPWDERDGRPEQDGRPAERGPADWSRARLDDPQPAGRSRPLAWVVAVVVLAAVGGGAYWLYQRTHANPAAGPGGKGAAGRPVPVVAAVARQGDLPLYLNGLGTVTPLNTVTVRTRVDGQIDSIHFDEGRDVAEGDLLAQIDPRPFQVQLEQAQGQLARDQATLDNARSELVRNEQAKEAIAAQVLETARAAVAQAEGVVKSDQAAVHNAELQLTYARVTSPIGGRVGLRYVDKGNIVHATDATGLAVITQLKPITVIFTLPQGAIDRVRRAMAAAAAEKKQLQVEVWDRDVKLKLATGGLAAVDNQVDPTTGTFRLKATVENADEGLYPNQFVNARLLVETRKAAVLAPTAAVQRGPDSTFAYVVKDDAVELRPVTVGPTEGDVAVIEQGLAAGDVVVTDGVDKLQPGSKVTAKVGGRGGAASRLSGPATQKGENRNPKSEIRNKPETDKKKEGNEKTSGAGGLGRPPFPSFLLASSGIVSNYGSQISDLRLQISDYRSQMSDFDLPAGAPAQTSSAALLLATPDGGRS